MMRKLFFRRFILAPSAAAVVLLAQQQGGPTTGGGGGATTGGGGGTGTTAPSPGTGTSLPRGTTTFPTQQQQPQMPQMPQTVFFTGKVVMEDGTAPTEPVTIEQVCNGMPRPQAYTDSKGRFSYSLNSGRGGAGMGSSGNVLPDASISSSDTMGSSYGGGGMAGSAMGGAGMLLFLAGCEIRANLPGYRSSTIMLSNRSALDNPEVGTIFLKPLGNREGTVFSATNLMAPKDAKKALEKGRELAKKKKPADARKEFDKAVELYPKFASAWYEIGLLEEAAKNPEGARKAYAQALAADPKYVNPYNRMFMMSVDEKNWQDVADTTARLLKLNPYDFPNAYYFNAVANFNLKHYDEAGKSAKALYEQDEKRFSRAGYLLGLVMATREDYSGASTHLKQYLDRNPQAQDRELVAKQLAEIEKFAGAGAKP